MTRYELDILEHLANTLLRLYCQLTCNIGDVSEWEMRDHLMSGIRKHWNAPFDFIPSERTFHRAFREDKCGSAMREKMAFMYFAFVEKLSAEEFCRIYKDIKKRRQMVITPYWDRYVALYEEEHPAEDGLELSKDLQVMMKGIKLQEKHVLFKWLKKELRV